MNIHTQRRIDAWVGPLLCGLVSLWGKCFGRTVDRQQPVQQVLVIMLSEMGSMVLAGPMFARIQNNHPGVQVHILQLKRNQSVARLLGLAPDSHLHGIDDSGLFSLLGDLLRVLWRLRRLKLDAVIDCELFSRISALLAYGSGARLIAGFTPHTQEGLYRGSFFNAAIPYNPYRHITLQFMALVDALSSASTPRTKAIPLTVKPQDSGLQVHFSDGDMASFTRDLHRDHPLFMQAKKRILFYAGGGLLPIRAWPAAHYAALAKALCEQGHAVGIIGLPEDQALAQSIQAECSYANCLNFVGYTKNLEALTRLFFHSDLLVTNDGGPGHFASLTPVRTLMFFGPETSALYGPLTPRAIALESHLACSPCVTAYNHRATPCDGDNQCLKQIQLQQVLALALTQLELCEPRDPAYV
ncbi:MAG: glycosyltransferase family 9 protein [Limnohabitans sp.]|nr:glycosyltransferase family 9 protein [Limnohabitans sp.]